MTIKDGQTAPEYRIRPAGPDQIDAIVHLIRRSYRDVAVRFRLDADNCPKHPSNCRPEWITQAMQKEVAYYLLESGPQLCGCVAFERAPDPAAGYLERLAVLPAFRRRGFGQALVRRALDEARAAGVARVEIGIIAEQGELAAWYQRLGFVETRRARFDHLPFEVAFMARSLGTGTANESELRMGRG